MLLYAEHCQLGLQPTAVVFCSRTGDGKYGLGQRPGQLKVWNRLVSFQNEFQFWQKRLNFTKDTYQNQTCVHMIKKIVLIFSFFLSKTVCVLQLDWVSDRRTQEINFPKNRKGYGRVIIYVLIGSWCVAFPLPSHNCSWLSLRVSSEEVWAIWRVTQRGYRRLPAISREGGDHERGTRDVSGEAVFSCLEANLPSWHIYPEWYSACLERGHTIIISKSPFLVWSLFQFPFPTCKFKKEKLTPRLLFWICLLLWIMQIWPTNVF